MEETRQIVRCTHCKLRQFMTRSTNCRKCGKSLIVVVAPPKVEVVTPLARVAQKGVGHTKDGQRAFNGQQLHSEDLKKLAMAFATVVRRERNAQGISQLRLSARSGLSRPYINCIEKAKKGAARPETVAKLAQGLGFTVEMLTALVEAAL